MNGSRIVFVIAVFLLGSAVGWLVRGGGGGLEGGAPTTTARPFATGPSGPSTGPDPAAAARPRERNVKPATPEGEVSRSEAGRFLADVRKDMELRLANWVQSLALTPAQVARLRVAIDNTMTAAETAADTGNFGGPWLDGAALTEALDGVLDDAQRQRWQDWQVRRRSARVEARASTALAEIESALVLDGAQPQAVREAMLRRAETEATDDAPPVSMAIAPDVLAEIQRRLTVDTEDPAAFETTAREVIGEKIERELAGLREVLRPEQLEAYRRLLTRKHAGWLNPAP